MYYWFIIFNIIKTFAIKSLIKTQLHRNSFIFTIIIIIITKERPIGFDIEVINDVLLFDSLFDFVFDDLFALCCLLCREYFIAFDIFVVEIDICFV